MEKSVSKFIGALLRLTGLGIILWGLITKNPAGGFGVLVGLIGRVIYEYFDDWFG